MRDSGSPQPTPLGNSIRLPGSRSGPLVIGLIGGVASGKSTVAAVLRDLGCAGIDADRICHHALQQADVRERVVAAFGTEILDDDGQIDRVRLRPAFDRPEALKRLEAILHPIVLERTRQMILEAVHDGRPGVVVDAPLLLEAGIERLCAVLILVDVPAATRRARARARGLGEADWGRRERRQLPIEEKRLRADHVLDADAPEEAVRARVVELWNRLRSPN